MPRAPRVTKRSIPTASRWKISTPSANWRANYTKEQKIDSSGDLPTGEKFTDVTDFRPLLLERHEQITRSLAQKLLTYAIGREPGITDRATVDAIVKGLRTPAAVSAT